MRIEIYADTLFVMNLVINLWILSLLRRRFAIQGKIRKDWAAAFAGTAVYIGFLWISVVTGMENSQELWRKIPAMQSQSERLFWYRADVVLRQLLVTVLSIGITTVIFLPSRKRYLWKKVIGRGLLYSLVIAGIVRAVLHKWQLLSGREITLWAVLLSVYICVQAGDSFLRKRKERRGKSICQAIIRSSGVKTGVMALVDTGNSLLEPVSGKPVCLIEEALLARITLENPLFYRAIPFRSVGCEQGILYGVEIPELTIYYEEQCYVVTNVICAGVPHKLSQKNKYRMIIHPQLCTDEKLQKA